jgi:hypothetical protein
MLDADSQVMFFFFYIQVVLFFYCNLFKQVQLSSVFSFYKCRL